MGALLGVNVVLLYLHGLLVGAIVAALVGAVVASLLLVLGQRAILLVLVLAGCVPDFSRLQPVPQPASPHDLVEVVAESSTPDSCDVTPTRLPLLKPGTEIGKGPPAGWSDRLFFGRSRLGSGDVASLSEEARRLVTLVSTVITAKVQEEQPTGKPPHYRLSGLAIGLAAEIGGKQVIVSSEASRQWGVKVGVLGRLALKKAEKRLERVRILARCNTLAVFDHPNYLLHEGQHRLVTYRFAVLVESKTGKLHTLVWVLEWKPDSEVGDALGPIQVLPPNYVEDAPIDVDGTKVFAGLPVSEDACALIRLPRGEKQIEWSDTLKELACQKEYTKEKAHELEKQLWKGLEQARPRPESK